MPQLTFIWVFCTTVVSAVVSCVHFELAPQPPLQLLSLSSSFIDPDLSWMMSTSGGNGMTGTMLVPQVMPPVPGPTSPPPPEVKPIPVPLPVTPPAPLPVPFPELAALPEESDSPGAPGLNPQPTTEEIKSALTICRCSLRIK